MNIFPKGIIHTAIYSQIFSEICSTYLSLIPTLHSVNKTMPGKTFFTLVFEVIFNVTEIQAK